MRTPPAYQLFVGIDIAAKTFVAAWTSPLSRHDAPTFAQTSEGFTGLQEQLAATGTPPGQTLIVMEATGSYWVALAVTLHTVGYQVAVVNPAHIHNYVKSLPRRSKTDVLDAHALLHFATERQPAPWTPPPRVYHELRQRLVARDAVAEMRQQARNQRHALHQWPVQVPFVMQQFDAIEVDLDARIAALDQEIVTILQDGAWAESAALLQTIPGIGLCATPGTAVAFVGLAPLQHESGTSVRGRPRIPRGGHGRLRKALYVASLSAARHNPVIKPFYERLRAAIDSGEADQSRPVCCGAEIITPGVGSGHQTAAI